MTTLAYIRERFEFPACSRKRELKIEMKKDKGWWGEKKKESIETAQRSLRALDSGIRRRCWECQVWTRPEKYKLLSVPISTKPPLKRKIYEQINRNIDSIDSDFAEYGSIQGPLLGTLYTCILSSFFLMHRFFHLNYINSNRGKCMYGDHWMNFEK